MLLLTLHDAAVGDKVKLRANGRQSLVGGVMGSRLKKRVRLFIPVGASRCGLPWALEGEFWRCEVQPGRKVRR